MTIQRPSVLVGSTHEWLDELFKTKSFSEALALLAEYARDLYPLDKEILRVLALPRTQEALVRFWLHRNDQGWFDEEGWSVSDTSALEKAQRRTAERLVAAALGLTTRSRKAGT